MKNKLAIVAIVALAVVGCKSTGDKMQNETTSSEITNNTWELVKLDGEKIDQSNTDGKKIQFTLNSVDKMAYGYSGCNTFNGSYTLGERNGIKFSRMASTRMACPDTDIKEQKVLDIFNQADNYTLKGDMLTINKDRKMPLAVFKKVSPEDKIVEKHWKLIKLEGQDIVMDSNQERDIYFKLKADDNRVHGFAGCNNLSGGYNLEDGNRISFSNIAVTMKACPDVDLNEAEFLKVFELADNYSFSGDKLMLNVGRRAPLAVFEAVYK